MIGQRQRLMTAEKAFALWISIFGVSTSLCRQTVFKGSGCARVETCVEYGGQGDECDNMAAEGYQCFEDRLSLEDMCCVPVKGIYSLLLDSLSCFQRFTGRVFEGCLVLGF